MAVVDKNKLLGTPEKGGDLMVRPTTSLVGSSGGKITKTSDEKDVVYTISTKLVKVDKFLKGNLEAEKVAQKKEQKQKEDELRVEQEQDKEKPDKKDEKETPKSLIPKLSFLDGIKQWIGKVLVGWLTFRLIKFLPKIISILKPLAAFADLVINIGGKLLDGLVTFVDWGYKAVKGTEEWVGDVFGKDSAAKFKNFAETFTKFLNVALIAAMIGAKGGMLGIGGKGNRGIVNTGKRVIKRARRLFDPKRAEKLKRLKRIKELAKKRKAAEAALKRARMLRKLRPTNLRRVARVVTGKPIRAVSNIIKSPVVKNVVQSTQNAIRNAPQTLKNIKQAGADKIDDVAKTGKNWFGKVKGFGKNLWGKAGQAYNFLGKQGQKFINWADDFGKKFMANIDEIVKGIGAKASKWATQIGDIAEMAKNPAKLVEKVKGVLSGQLDDILKQNKTIAQLRNLDPKKASGAIKGLLDNAKKSKGLTQVRNALKGAQKMKIGGVDKVIAAVMGLLDYTLLGESPINAILRALGGLLGYTAGFAIGAPFGGVPGFITGMAGGFVGEQASRLISKVLAKSPLGQIQDPIMNDGRMLVRDPDDQGMNEQLEQDQKEIAEERGDGDKIDKTFKMGDKTYDLSKVMGGLSREEFDALDTRDQERINRRISIWRNQNKEEWVASVKGNANNIVSTNGVSNKVNGVSSSASYEDGVEETVIIKSGSQEEVPTDTESSKSITPVVVGAGGGNDEIGDLLYKGG